MRTKCVKLIGDASILDLNRLEELNKIAEAEGKIMFVDEVRRDIDQLQVVGYEDIKHTIEGKKKLEKHLNNAAKMTKKQEADLEIKMATGEIDEGHMVVDPNDQPQDPLEEEGPSTLF